MRRSTWRAVADAGRGAPIVAGTVDRVVEVVEQRGSVAELHALDPFSPVPPDRPVVWHQRFRDDAIVLGSRQSAELVDAAQAQSAGLDVARRRSGGGAVLLRPGQMLWVDLLVPPGVVPDDVRGSMIWLGEVWRDALGELGAATDAMTVHRGGLTDTRWAELVCFAGVGPGEIVVGDHKLMGLSQRRTRHGVRAQCLVHRTNTVIGMRDLFAVDVPREPLPDPATLADLGLGDCTDDEIVEQVRAALGRRLN